MVKKLVIAASLLAYLAAPAQTTLASPINFSNIVLNGTLAPGANVNLGMGTLDLLLDAAVGDGFPARTGTLQLIYTVQSPTPLIMDENIVSILGALSGSGRIFFNEVVEDLSDPADPRILATHSALIDDFAQLPYVDTLVFARPSDHIKVKKTIFLAAPDTPDFDLASVLLVEQTLSVPEPASLVLLMLGTVLLRRRAA